MLKIKKIVLLIISILLFNIFFISCYATAVDVTKENLDKTLQEFLSSIKDSGETDFEAIDVSDDIITIKYAGDSYTINYDLTEKPKFTIEVPIKQGMSYEDFKKQMANAFLPMSGYMAIANIQGVDFEVAEEYFVMSVLSKVLGGSSNGEDSYVIVDDTNVTVDKSKGDSKTIYVSEFGEKVMEYVNDMFKDKQTITDVESSINSFELTIEKEDINETSCKLVSSLSVNIDADFSKIKEYVDQFAESFLNRDITKDNADYPITLKVGQKCRFETNGQITGYEILGSGCEGNRINENCIEIVGKRVGKTNGYIEIGETKKTFYITVEENTEGKALDDITIKINTATENKNSSGQNQGQTQNSPSQQNKSQQNNGVSKDKTTAKGTLPKTGASNVIHIVMIIGFVLLAISGIKFKKYKDIK